MRYLTFVLLVSENYSYLCTYGTKCAKPTAEDVAAAVARRCDTILDVPRLRFSERGVRDAARHGLDVDAAVAALRRAGAGYAGVALEADAGADHWRE